MDFHTLSAAEMLIIFTVYFIHCITMSEIRIEYLYQTQHQNLQISLHIFDTDFRPGLQRTFYTVCEHTLMNTAMIL